MIVFELDSVPHANRSPLNPSILRCPYCMDCIGGSSLPDLVISMAALNSHYSDSIDRDWVGSMATLIDAERVAVARCVRNCFDSPCWCWCCIAAAATSLTAANWFAYNGHSGRCIRLSPTILRPAPAHRHHFELHSADDRKLVANLHKKGRKN